MKQSYENELTPEVREKMKKNLVSVGIFSIIMLFAGLTSAYIVSMGDSFWLKVPLPKAFWVSTVLIALSSITFILGVRAAKQKKIGALKVFISITMLCGIGFVYFQFRGYGQLVDGGIHPGANRILVSDGRYGDYFTLKYKGNYLEIDGNDYYLEGKLASPEAMNAIRDFGKQLDHADDKNGLENLKGYGTDFVLFYRDEPLTYLNASLIKPSGEKLLSRDLYRLRFLAYHLRDGRGDFFARGKIGKDFHIYYKGEELSYKNRTLYKKGNKKLLPYELNKAMDSSDSASSYLFIITCLHLAHIIVTLLFMIRTVIYSFTGKYTEGDTLGLRVTGIFWHFLGLLWLYLLLFLLFIH